VNAKKLSVLVVGFPLAFAACGGDDLTLPSEGQPAHIEVVSTGLQGRVNSELEDQLLVRVTDSQDRPVQGATVEFALQEDGGGGTVSPTGTTDVAGQATASLLLGTRVGQMTGRAQVPVDEGSVPVTTDFTVTVLSADARGIALFTGDQQAGPVNTVLTQPLVVQVTDGYGNPISGLTVGWSAEGGGSVSATSTQTDGQGLTSVERTLGSTAGLQTTLASAEGLAGSPVTFTHTATAGNAARVTIVSGNGQQAAPGSQLPAPLVVQVLDENNNPITARAVAWVVGTGDGSVNPETSTTDEQGRASTDWTLGAEPGRNTLTAVVSGASLAAFTATGTKTASSTSIVSHQPEPSTVNQAVEVRVEVTGSGGVPTGTVNVTGNGAAPCTITLSNGTGSCALTFPSAGDQPITATYAGDVRFNGSSDSENHRVESENTPPTAAFSPPSCTAGQPCPFNDGSTDSDGSVVGWAWDFGDGGASNEQNPSHIYAAAGSYNVKLTVRDDDGATSEVTQQVTVNAAPINNPPTAAFTHSDCSAGMECQFTDASTDPEGNSTIVAWEWDFGDFSGPSTEQNPKHTYIVGAGFTYRVTLTVRDNQGLTGSTFQDVTVP
jgi:PKD repeat protein